MSWLRPAPINLISDSRLLEEVGRASRVLDAGCGGRRLGADVVGVDVARRRGVDVVGDLCGRLPFANEVFDLVVCCSVLEHVIDETSAVEELLRVTRRGGQLWVEVPFLYHFHVSGIGDVHDYRRWTLEGVKALLPKCTIVEFGHNVGPGTALRLIAAEVLSMPFHSERHSSPYYLSRWLWDWLLLPLSALDRFCAAKSVSHRATGGFWILAQKS